MINMENFIKRFHVSLEMKPDFTRGVHFFIMHGVIVPVHKTEFCFVICGVDSLNHSCLMWLQ